MDEVGADTCVVELPYPHMETRPLLDFGAGYVQRSLHELPRQGMHSPWELAMSVATDVRVLEQGPVQHRNLHFARARQPEADHSGSGAAAGVTGTSAAGTGVAA
jgi:monooxygenase